MAAYMRKTGIPVCTNNEARAYFAGKGLAYADVTEGDILALVMLLNEHRFCVAFETHKTGGKLPKGTCRPCNPDF